MEWTIGVTRHDANIHRPTSSQRGSFQSAKRSNYFLLYTAFGGPNYLYLQAALHLREIEITYALLLSMYVRGSQSVRLLMEIVLAPFNILSSRQGTRTVVTYPRNLRADMM